MIRLSGLWLKERDNGEKFFSGSMGGLAFKVFKNSYKKEGDNEPDYILYMDENKPQRTVPKVTEEEKPF